MCHLIMKSSLKSVLSLLSLFILRLVRILSEELMISVIKNLSHEVANEVEAKCSQVKKVQQ